MAITKLKKKELSLKIEHIYENYNTILIIRYYKMNMLDLTKIRSRLREVNGLLKMIKISLSKRILLNTKKTQNEKINKMFYGPTALIYSNELLPVVKIICNLEKTNTNLKLTGGIINKKFSSSNLIKELSKFHSLDHVKIKIIKILRIVSLNIIRYNLLFHNKLVKLLKIKYYK